MSKLAEMQVICYTYVNVIKTMEEYPGIYTLENMRSELHQKICRLFKLTQDQTKQITDNLDKIKYDGGELCTKLLELRNKVL
jgi:hypothetical protein